MAVLLNESQFKSMVDPILKKAISGKVITYKPEEYSTLFFLGEIEITSMHNYDLNQMSKNGDFSKLVDKIDKDAYKAELYVSKSGQRFEINDQAFDFFNITVYRNQNYSKALLRFASKVGRKQQWMYLEIRKDRMIYNRVSIDINNNSNDSIKTMLNNLDSFIKEQIKSDCDINFKERVHKKAIQAINIKYSDQKKEPEIISANVVEIPQKRYRDQQFKDNLFDGHMSAYDSTIFSHSRIVNKSDTKVVVDVLRVGQEVTYKRYDIFRDGEQIIIKEININVPEQLAYIKSSLDCEQNPLNGPVHNFFKDYPPAYKGVDIWVTTLGVIWMNISGQWVPLYNELQLQSLSHLNPMALQEYEIWKNVSKQ